METILKAGTHFVEVSTEELPEPGVYYYQLNTGNFSGTKKMVLMK